MKTQTASGPPSPSSSNVLRQHALVCYVLLAYGFTWVYVLVFLVLFHSPWNLSVLGPPMAALIMTALTEGTPGTRRLLRHIVLWRVGVQWYLFALLGILGMCLFGTILLPGAFASYHAPSLDFMLHVPLIFGLAFLLGPLFEEVGWRGFALSRMQRLQGPLLGSLLLGILWAFWHLPFFLLAGFAHQNGGLSLTSLSVFTLTAIAVTIIMTWCTGYVRRVTRDEIADAVG